MLKSAYVRLGVTILFLAFAFFAYKIVEPFFISVISAIVIAYIFRPVYLYLLRYIKSKRTAAFIMTLLIIILTAIPLVLFFNAIKDQARENYGFIKAGLLDPDPDICLNEDSMACNLKDWFSEKIIDSNLLRFINLEGIAREASSFVITFASSIPNTLLNLFIMFFSLFFFFKDWESMTEQLHKLIPLKLKHKKRIIKRLDNVVFAVVYGNLIVAIAQGSFALAGYMIFGVKTPLLWGFLTAIGALVPFFGTAIVWVPLSIFMLITGVFQNDISIIWRSVGLFIYGTLLISTIDNFLKPYIIGDRANIHPLVILLGVFGGIAMLGPVGLILGPIILALFLTSITIYMDERYGTEECEDQKA